MNRNPIKLIWFIDRSEILTLLDDGLSMRKTARKIGVLLSTVQRVEMANLTCFGSMDY
jgi:transposase-like protein